jgi:hypothetical protein
MISTTAALMVKSVITIMNHDRDNQECGDHGERGVTK